MKMNLRMKIGKPLNSDPASGHPLVATEKTRAQSLALAKFIGNLKASKT